MSLSDDRFDPGPPGGEWRDVRGARTVFSDYASVLGARFGSAFLSLISILITTRILAPAGYATVAYFAVVALLVFTVASAWTSTAVARYGREEFEAHGALVELTWARAAVSLPLFAIAALAVVGLQFADAFPSGFSWAFAWLSIAYAAVLIASDHLSYVLMAAGRMKLGALWMLLQQAAVVASLLVVFLVGLDADPLLVATLWVVWGAVFALALAARTLRLAWWPPRASRSLIRKVVRFSTPLIAFTVSQYLIRSVDLIVLGAYASATAVGVYAVAYQAYTVLHGLSTATGPVLTPLFVSLRTADREALVGQYYERVVPQLTFVAATLAGFAVPLVTTLVPVVFGDSFGDAAEPLSVLLFAVVLSMAANLLAPIVVLHERTKPIGAVSMAAAAVNVGGDLVLVGVLGVGVIGPAIATTVAMALIFVVYVRIARNCVGSSRVVSPAVLLPFVCGLAPVLAFPGAVGFGISVAATGLCAMAILVLVRPFIPADRHMVSQLDMPAPMKALTLRSLEFATTWGSQMARRTDSRRQDGG